MTRRKTFVRPLQAIHAAHGETVERSETRRAEASARLGHLPDESLASELPAVAKQWGTAFALKVAADRLKEPRRPVLNQVGEALGVGLQYAFGYLNNVMAVLLATGSLAGRLLAGAGRPIPRMLAAAGAYVWSATAPVIHAMMRGFLATAGAAVACTIPVLLVVVLKALALGFWANFDGRATDYLIVVTGRVWTSAWLIEAFAIPVAMLVLAAPAILLGKGEKGSGPLVVSGLAAASCTLFWAFLFYDSHPRPIARTDGIRVEQEIYRGGAAAEFEAVQYRGPLLLAELPGIDRGHHCGAVPVGWFGQRVRARFFLVPAAACFHIFGHRRGDWWVGETIGLSAVDRVNEMYHAQNGWNPR